MLSLPHSRTPTLGNNIFILFQIWSYWSVHMDLMKWMGLLNRRDLLCLWLNFLFLWQLKFKFNSNSTGCECTESLGCGRETLPVLFPDPLDSGRETGLDLSGSNKSYSHKHFSSACPCCFSSWGWLGRQCFRRPFPRDLLSISETSHP